MTEPRRLAVITASAAGIGLVIARRLAADGWRTLVVHECELRDREVLRARLGAALA